MAYLHDLALGAPLNVPAQNEQFLKVSILEAPSRETIPVLTCRVQSTVSACTLYGCIQYRKFLLRGCVSRQPLAAVEFKVSEADIFASSSGILNISASDHMKKLTDNALPFRRSTVSDLRVSGLSVFNGECDLLAPFGISMFVLCKVRCRTPGTF